jgi:hypothetical protein
VGLSVFGLNWGVFFDQEAGPAPAFGAERLEAVRVGQTAGRAEMGFAALASYPACDYNSAVTVLASVHIGKYRSIGSGFFVMISRNFVGNMISGLVMDK